MMKFLGLLVVSVCLAATVQGQGVLSNAVNSANNLVNSVGNTATTSWDIPASSAAGAGAGAPWNTQGVTSNNALFNSGVGNNALFNSGVGNSALFNSGVGSSALFNSGINNNNNALFNSGINSNALLTNTQPFSQGTQFNNGLSGSNLQQAFLNPGATQQFSSNFAGTNNIVPSSMSFVGSNVPYQPNNNVAYQQPLYANSALPFNVFNSGFSGTSAVFGSPLQQPMYAPQTFDDFNVPTYTGSQFFNTMSYPPPSSQTIPYYDYAPQMFNSMPTTTMFNQPSMMHNPFPLEPVQFGMEPMGSGAFDFGRMGTTQGSGEKQVYCIPLDAARRLGFNVPTGKK